MGGLVKSSLFRGETRRATLCTMACVLLVLMLPSTGDAAPRLRSISITTGAELPAARPDFPRPNEPNMLFYIQRSTNSNTVIYRAIQRADGSLDPKQPVQIYWRRYNTTGVRKALNFVETRFAYGVTTRNSGTLGEFTVRFRSLPVDSITLRLSPSKEPGLYTVLGERPVRLSYAYVELDERSLLPKVTRLTIYGIFLDNGNAVRQVFSVSGADVDN